MPDIPACGCGCGLWVMDGKIVSIAELLQTRFPDIVWTSGSRCEKHNSAVGGSVTSGHLPAWGDNGIESVALDGTLRQWDRFRLREVLRRAVQHGARGIGNLEDDKAFHIDLKPRTAWWTVRGGKIAYFF